MTAEQMRKRQYVVLGMWLLVCTVIAGCQSIYDAARDGNVALVEKRLRQGVDPDKRHFLRLSTPMIDAAVNGHLDVVMVLVENGADVNEHGDTYQRPLHFASYNGDVEMVEYLLAHGANTDKALHSAARGGQVQVAQILLDHKAEINQKGIDEATPLEQAVASEQVDMVKFLLERGADVNSQGLYGRTALHVAAWKDNLVLAKMLLDNGADPTLECNGNRVQPHSEAFRMLLAKYESDRH